MNKDLDIEDPIEEDDFDYSWTLRIVMCDVFIVLY